MLGLILLAFAQSTAAAPPPSASITRVAAAFDAFDAAYHAAGARPEGLAAPERAAFNRRFDAVSRRFFTLDLEGACESLEQLTRELGGAVPEPRPFAPRPLLDEAERAWLAALADDADAPLRRAARAVRSRVRWLEGEANEVDRFVLGGATPPASPATVRADLARLRAGEDPFERRAGERDHWRTFVHGRRDLRARVHCPAGLDLSAPVPLVVVFHGAGGNEHFFFETAGDGHLRGLADRLGFIAVTPFTPDYTLGPRALDALLDGVAASYPVDPARVYVVGHSLGGVTVANLCRLGCTRIRAAVCIAGYGDPGPVAPRTLVLAGDLDGVVPFAAVRASATAAAAAGAPVRFEAMTGEGHTLLLPAALERAARFLLGG